MKRYALRLIEDVLPAGGRLDPPLSACIRVMYIVEGRADFDVKGNIEDCKENSAWFGTGPCIVTVIATHARIWRWEIVSGDASDTGEALRPGVTSKLKLRATLELDPSQKYMLRCDRVDFLLGGVAYTHTHRGPGIRCLLRGSLEVKVNNKSKVMRPGGPWFERGVDPVLANASHEEITSFVRAMVLPRELKGKSSIHYEKPEDLDKPKPQQYTRFIDEFVDLEF